MSELWLFVQIRYEGGGGEEEEGQNAFLLIQINTFLQNFRLKAKKYCVYVFNSNLKSLT